MRTRWRSRTATAARCSAATTGGPDELDGTLRSALRCGREFDFPLNELGLMAVAIDTWQGFVFVNPDIHARPLREANPELDALAAKTTSTSAATPSSSAGPTRSPRTGRSGSRTRPSATTAPTVHRASFSDAFDTDEDVYELIESGNLLCQFTRYQPREGAHSDGRFAGMTGKGGFRFIYQFPTSFWAQDDYVAFTGMVVPTGPETCTFIADVFSHPDAGEQFVQDWMEMYNQTLLEDKEVVLVQQPGLRSNMVPYGRLLPRSESPIMHFHRLVRAALAATT